MQIAGLSKYDSCQF